MVVDGSMCYNWYRYYIEGITWGMRITKRYLLMLLTVVSLLIFSFLILWHYNHKLIGIRAKDGVLDLSQYSFREEGALKLEGQWELYKNQLLTAKDFAEGVPTNREIIEVPGAFTMEGGEEAHPGFGYATYRLRVKLSPEFPIMGFKLLTMSTAYTLMIDDEVITKVGQVGTSKDAYRSAYKPQVVLFNREKENFDIIIHVANYTYNRIGMWHSIILGSHKQVLLLREVSIKRTVSIMGGLIFMFIYQVGIYMLQRRRKQANKYLIISMVIMFIRLICTGEYFINIVARGISVSSIAWLEYMTIIWAPAVIVYFNRELFPEEVTKRFVRIVTVVTILCTVSISILPVYVYARLLIVYELIYVSIFMYLIWCNHKSILRNRDLATLCLVGHGFVIFTCIADVLYYNQMIYIMDGGMTPFSVFVIIGLHMFILAKRHELSYEKVTTLSETLIKQDKIKDEFLANTSHEIRTPLHGMISLMEHVEERGENLSIKQRENLKYAISSGRRLANLVNDILDYAKLKYDDIELNLRTIPLAPVVQFVIDTQRFLIKDNQVVLEHIIDSDIKVYVDENRLIQILTNLINNAIKFTEEGSIRIHCLMMEEEAIICVEDTGAGMPEEKLKTIFEAYEQLQENRATLGTGLGLNISKHLVELHGGRIWVESVLGEGSRFYLTVPKGTSEYEEEAASYQIASENLVNQNQFFQALRVYQENRDIQILIVDDDFTNLHSLINILSHEPYRLLVTSNCQEAKKVIDGHNLDMVILDIMMDDISGYDLCEYIRQKHTLFQLPVLLLTAQVNDEALLHGFKTGANDFLTKPFGGEELKARIRTLVKMKLSVEEAISHEAAFLQAQIKPHFIYNAINTMVSLCDTDPCRASDLLVEFSIYLRKSFDFSNTKQLIPLDSELDYIKSYLMIQQARFQDKIECHYHVEDDIGLMIPPLILQPLVENAVQHGIRNKEGKGRIDIHIHREQEQIILSVVDDGVGLEDGRLISILEDEGQSKSVGLKNINKRLIHYYGVGLKIDSSLGRGCRVTITIPEQQLKEVAYASNDY